MQKDASFRHAFRFIDPVHAGLPCTRCTRILDDVHRKIDKKAGKRSTKDVPKLYILNRIAKSRLSSPSVDRSTSSLKHAKILRLIWSGVYRQMSLLSNTGNRTERYRPHAIVIVVRPFHCQDLQLHKLEYAAKDSITRLDVDHCTKNEQNIE